MYQDKNTMEHYPPTATVVSEKIENARREAIARETTESNRQHFLSMAEMDGVQVVHVFDKEDTKGGLTIAFCKSMPYASTNMVDVAVVTCSRMDNFNRKVGTYLALKNFYGGAAVSLPLSTGYADEDLAGNVKKAFSALYYSIH